MMSLVKNLLEITPTTNAVSYQLCLFEESSLQKKQKCVIFRCIIQGDRRPFVMETVKADDKAKFGMLTNHFVL